MYPELDFNIESVSVSSGVSAQPMSDEETLLGATQRAEVAKSGNADADFWVGIEGGIEDVDLGMVAFAWVVVLSDHQTGLGRTGGFILPARVAELVRQGKELGDANDMVFVRENSKQKEGAIGLLTHNAMDRRELYEHAMVLALVSLKNPELYPQDSASD